MDLGKDVRIFDENLFLLILLDYLLSYLSINSDTFNSCSVYSGSYSE